jgi:LmbE family N-acetylglucosaminyl deacetylase
MTRDVTLLIAHPDDEAIFLWPFLSRVKRIVCASNDAFNPERTFCKERGLCLAEVGKLLGCEIVCQWNNSEFYRVPTRNGALHLIVSDLLRTLEGAEIVATHNAWGEYGHIDHLLCHHIARTHQARHGGQLLVTDIAVTESPAWVPILAWEQGKPHVHTWDQMGSIALGNYTYEIDRPLFDRIKAIYDARGCWTWSWEPQATCGVYSL